MMLDMHSEEVNIPITFDNDLVCVVEMLTNVGIQYYVVTVVPPVEP